MKEKLKVPKLRFKEFSGEWEEKNLGDICQIQTGNKDTQDKIENGKYPFFVRSQQVERIDSYSYDGEAILTAGDGVGVGKVFHYINGKFDFHQRVYKLSDFIENIDIKYIFSYFSENFKHETRKYTAKTSVDSVRMEMLTKMLIPCASLPEQQKIADFLSLVDEKIEKLTKKKELLEQYKKGVMQKIFSQELRFKDDNGKEFPEWEEKEVEEIFNTISTKEYQIKASEIVENGLFPVIDQGQKLVAGYCNDKQKLFFEELPVIIYGDHTTIIKYINYDFVIGADGTKILKNKIDGNLKFLYYSLCYNNIEPEGYKRHFSIIRKVLLNLPSLPEQQKIAYFLSSLDKKIDIALQELGQVQEFKKGLLQQMFV